MKIEKIHKNNYEKLKKQKIKEKQKDTGIQKTKSKINSKKQLQILPFLTPSPQNTEK